MRRDGKALQRGRKGRVRQLIAAMLLLGWTIAMSGGAAASEVPRIQGELTILTAASLTNVFKEMAAQIEQANPGTKLTFNFAGSPTLRTQLSQGARADVFASADEPNMHGAEPPCCFRRVEDHLHLDGPWTDTRSDLSEAPAVTAAVAQIAGEAPAHAAA